MDTIRRAERKGGYRMERRAIIFFDSGDTLVDESKEIKDESGIVQDAELIEGADETIRTLFKEGYTLAIVADGDEESFINIYSSKKLLHMFKAVVASRTVGVDKPAKVMFTTMMNELKLTDEDSNRIIMVGNNIERDVVGANNMGFTSVLINWSPRYRMTPQTENEVPDYIISAPLELLQLVEELNDSVTIVD